MRYVIDIETNGLKATRIHCLSYCDMGGVVYSLTTMAEIKEFLQQPDLELICHNVMRYDKPTLERLLGITIDCTFIDTLGLSWYLEPERSKHGLEYYGEEFGVPKPVITDWESLTTEDYVHRCEEDVKINFKLWNKQYNKLTRLYSGQDMMRLINYLAFKMDCLREQEEVGLALDVEHVQQMLRFLEDKKAVKVKELEAAMPKVPVVATKKRPKVMYKKDLSLSSAGTQWMVLLEEYDLPQDTEEVKIIVDYEEPNSNSHEQIKDWLYSLGWKPENIKFVRDKKKNTTKQIPQIAHPKEKGDVCESVKKLYVKEPKLELLAGLTILSHRISVFKGFLKDNEDGRLYGTAAGFTNTLRLQHSVLVNLPGIAKPYGSEIRSSLIADDRHVLCGSDLAGIEDVTKRHYIFPYDPKYVEEMNTPGFDPHLDIGIRADMLTEDDADFFKRCEKEMEDNAWKPNIEEKKRYYALKEMRGKSKVVNFSATYKVGAAALARNSNMPESWSKKILKIYWERNWAILKIEEDCKVKEIDGQKWLFNPISQLWYSLRADKDRFSTLNQGTAAYVFDIWITYLRQMGLKIAMQYHDEVLLNVRKGQQKVVKNIINKAIVAVNDRLKLNVRVGCSTKFGNNYASVH